MISIIHYYQQNTLNDALKQTYWRAEQRGPLLVVGLEQEPKQPLPPVPASGYSAPELAGYFDRALLKAGEVTALAPRTMRLFTKPTLPPEQAALYNRHEAGAALLGSLSKPQQRHLREENGLGWSELDAQQKPLFLALLPTRLTLDPVDTTKPKRTIADDQRTSLRLRVARRPQLTYIIEGTRETISFGEDNAHGQDYYLQTSADDEDENAALLNKLFPTVANRLKPSDLDFTSARLDARVPLADLKTVGELLQRLGERVSLTLTADYRVRDQALTLRGNTARAGDLLQALCLSLCGTLRKIDSNTYLLTEDKEGLTPRQAAYDRWLAQVQALAEARQQRTQNDEALPTLGGELSGAPRQLLPTTALPASLKAQVERDKKREFTYTTPEGATRKGTIRTDQVLVDLQPETQVVFPELGGFPTPSLNLAHLLQNALPQQAKPKILTWSPLWKERVLTVAVATPQEATEAVSLAKKGGLTELWLALPAAVAPAKPLLDAALRAGKKEGLAVGAQVGVLTQPQDTLLPLDKTSLGETLSPLAGSLAVTPSPRLAAQVQATLESLRTTPRLHRLVWESAFPGYAAGETQESYRALGYSPENRAAVFQKTGSDLLDLPHREFAVLPIPLGYFSVVPNSSPIPKLGRTLRQEPLQRFLSQLEPSPKSPLRSLKVAPVWTKSLLLEELEQLPRTLPGVVLDLSALSFAQAKTLLEGLFP